MSFLKTRQLHLNQEPTFKNAQAQTNFRSKEGTTLFVSHERETNLTKNDEKEKASLDSSCTKRTSSPKENVVGNCHDDASNTLDAEITKRLHPSSTDDFHLLRSELIKWRDLQYDNIEKKEDLSPDQTISARTHVVYQETLLLKKIDELESDVAARIKRNAIENFLKRLTTLEPWDLRDGGTIEVDTPETVYRKKLVDLYKIIQDGDATAVDKKKCLSLAKSAISRNDGKQDLGKEICELIDRQIDFLNRGIENSAHGQRTRLSNLILQLLRKLETKTF